MKNFRYILRYYIDPGYEEDTRIAELVDFCKRSTVDEVMLFFNPEELNDGHITIEKIQPWLVMAKKLKQILTDNGVSMSVNPWTTLVHSPRGRKLKEGQNFNLMVGENGKNNGVTVCPLCKNWLDYMCSLWSLVAAGLQPEAMWIEDDWRLHNHGRILGWGGCFCEEHLQKFSEKIGRKVSREEIIADVYAAGSVHPWRKIYLELNGELMTAPIRKLREAVKKASPETKVALMCAGIDINSAEGRNWHALQDAVGFDPEFTFRPTISPYTEVWAMQQFPVHARMITAALKRPLDICPELETGPRHGIYSKSNSFAGWELEQCIAFGANAITINHFDMLGCGTCTAPGFAEMLRRKRPRLEAVSALQLDDDDSLGANILFSTENAKYLKMENSGISALNNHSDEWGKTASILGFSHRYTQEIIVSAQVTLVSGQTLNAFDDEKVRELLSGKVILDAIAAQGVIERGFGEYLGFDSAPVRHYHNVSAYSYEEIPESDPALYGVKNPRMTIQRACRQLYEFTPAYPRVKILSNIRKFDHTLMFGGVFSYDNPAGGRVVTLSYPLGDQGDSEWFYMGWFNPFRRIFMHRLLRRTAPDMTIACCEDHPMQTHRLHFDGGEFFAAFNAATDAAEKVVLNITNLPAGSLELLNADGKWVKDDALSVQNLPDGQNRIIFNREIPVLGSFMCRIIK